MCIAEFLPELKCEGSSFSAVRLLMGERSWRLGISIIWSM